MDRLKEVELLDLKEWQLQHPLFEEVFQFPLPNLSRIWLAALNMERIQIADIKILSHREESSIYLQYRERVSTHPIIIIYKI